MPSALQVSFAMKPLPFFAAHAVGTHSSIHTCIPFVIIDKMKQQSIVHYKAAPVISAGGRSGNCCLQAAARLW